MNSDTSIAGKTLVVNNGFAANICGSFHAGSDYYMLNLHDGDNLPIIKVVDENVHLEYKVNENITANPFISVSRLQDLVDKGYVSIT